MITNAQIWGLRVRSAENRDDARVAVCDIALDLWRDRPDPYGRQVGFDLCGGDQKLTRDDARRLCARWLSSS